MMMTMVMVVLSSLSFGGFLLVPSFTNFNYFFFLVLCLLWHLFVLFELVFALVSQDIKPRTIIGIHGIFLLYNGLGRLRGFAEFALEAGLAIGVSISGVWGECPLAHGETSDHIEVLFPGLLVHDFLVLLLFIFNALL